MKHCARCGEYKDEKDFYYDTHNGRLASYCRPCNNNYQRVYNDKYRTKEHIFKRLYGWTKESHPREFKQFADNYSDY